MKLLGVLTDRNHKRVLRHVAHTLGFEVDVYTPDELVDIEDSVFYDAYIMAQTYDDTDETGLQLRDDLLRNHPGFKRSLCIIIQNAQDEQDSADVHYISEFSIEEELQQALVKTHGSHSTKPQSTVLSQPQLSSKKILYISDDRLMHAIVKDLYKGDPTELHHAYDGESGYQIYREMKPDLILTDLDIPVMDGFELLKKIKTDDRDDHTIILLFSSTNDEATILKAYSLKAKGYLIKPLKPQVLKAKVEKYLHPDLH